MSDITLGILIIVCVINLMLLFGVMWTMNYQYKATVQIFDRLEKLEQDQKGRKREAAGAQEKMR